MKKILTLSFIILLSSHLFPQWEVLNQGYNLWSIKFVNEKTGWITASEGKILKTTDGGNSWITLKTDNSWYINDFNFINETTGWTIGSKEAYAIIIKTTDGGASWTIQYEISQIWLNMIFPVDESTVYAGSADKIFRTINGGNTWINVSPDSLQGRFISSIWFTDPQNGIAIGGYFDGTNQVTSICRTTNGGNDWQESIKKDFLSIFDVQVMNDSTAFFKAYADTNLYLCKTEDMFSTWTIRTRTKYGFGSYQFIDTTTGYALVVDNFNFYSIMKTSDGGYSWEKIPSPQMSSRLNLTRVWFTKPDNGFIVAGFGCLFRSNDETSWELVRNAYPLRSAMFFDKQRGILFGGYYAGFHEMFPSGDMFKTTDGGKTYTAFFNAPDAFKSSAMINDSVLIVSGKSIYKSTDGGNNWDIKYTARSDSGGFMFGPDPNVINEIVMQKQNGWAVGRDWDPSAKSGRSVILNTTDTGETWETVWQFKDSINQINYLLSVFCEDTSGWAVGYPGLIVKYSPHTGWVKQTSITSLPLVKVFAIKNNAWISGGYSYDQSVFFRTTNNGLTWKKIENFPFLINDFKFINENLGWAVGQNKDYKGVILRSTNGGDNWEIVVNDQPGKLNSLIIQDNYAWALGENGLVIRTTNLGITWTDDQDNVLNPADYRLRQNYPNPFNPNTTITWQLPVSGIVSIKIYDSLAKLVAVLINEEQTAGLHKTEFNGSHLSSGIYFCRLESGGHSASIKMLLMK